MDEEREKLRLAVTQGVVEERSARDIAERQARSAELRIIELSRKKKELETEVEKLKKELQDVDNKEKDLEAALKASQKSHQDEELQTNHSASVNEVSDGSANAAPTSSSKSSVPAPASEESMSEFIAQATNLVKLIDSRDIVELQLKRLDCELLIRKKEAFPQPQAQAPGPVMMHAPAQPPTLQPASPLVTSAKTSAPAPVASTPAPKSATSSHPPLKSPMAGTFYQSPAPEEPAFVKVGDKVQKGQVLCIIEAMNLMNEIEADRSGTVTEILVDDAKPVSVDTPLFVIEP